MKKIVEGESWKHKTFTKGRAGGPEKVCRDMVLHTENIHRETSAIGTGLPDVWAVRGGGWRNPKKLLSEKWPPICYLKLGRDSGRV